MPSRLSALNAMCDTAAMEKFHRAHRACLPFIALREGCGPAVSLTCVQAVINRCCPSEMTHGLTTAPHHAVSRVCWLLTSMHVEVERVMLAAADESWAAAAVACTPGKPLNSQVRLCQNAQHCKCRVPLRRDLFSSQCTSLLTAAFIHIRMPPTPFLL